MPLRNDPRADSSAGEVFDLCGEESEPAAGDDNEAPLATDSAHGGPALFLISDGAAERRKEGRKRRQSEGELKLNPIGRREASKETLRQYC